MKRRKISDETIRACFEELGASIALAAIEKTLSITDLPEDVVEEATEREKWRKRYASELKLYPLVMQAESDWFFKQMRRSIEPRIDQIRSLYVPYRSYVAKCKRMQEDEE